MRFFYVVFTLILVKVYLFYCLFLVYLVLVILVFKLEKKAEIK